MTTYRLMAEQTVDQIVKRLKGLNELKSEISPCSTANEPLQAGTDIEGVSGILPPEFSRRAVEHYCANEWAVHLEDVMIRRTSWSHYHSDAAQKAERVADWMAELLDWSDKTRASEIEHYHAMAGRQLATETSSSRTDRRRNDHRAASMI